MTTPPLVPGPAATVVDGATEGPVEVTGPLRRLLFSIAPANLAVFAVWGAVTAVLLPLQVEAFDESRKEANLAIVTTIGALFAMFAQPVAGALSDRTRSRHGRRSPWIAGAALVGLFAFVGLALADSLMWVTITWVLVQIAYNFAQGPLSAVLPDRVPRAVRGRFSALAGLGLMLGTVLGQVFGALVADAIGVGYLLLAAFALVTLVAFVRVNPEPSSSAMAREPFVLRDFLTTFWVSPRQHPDFAWAFVSRLFIYTGFNVVMTYQLYLLREYVGLTRGEAVSLVPVIGLVSVVGILATTLTAGPASDRVGRRKVFVVVGAVVIAIALVIPWVIPTVPGMIAFAFCMGLGFGAFQSVDTALMSEVLPSADSHAKDLGVVNIAQVLPQTIAPAVAGAVVLGFGYAGIFPVAIALSLLGALAVLPIRSVR